MKNLKLLFAIFSAVLFFLLWNSCTNSVTLPEEGIKIFQENPFYWKYNGDPTLLIGGTKDDNLFQIEDLNSHLELLSSVGGNYIRCTMSSRDDNNIKPYLKNEDGLFDLKQPNPEYWGKLDSLLHYCRQLNIIVQIEIWATYDFYGGAASWAKNPFNPLMNCNYTAELSGLPEKRTLPAQSGASPFFYTVPELDDNTLVLDYQKKFVDKLLSISFKYNNVLYSIDNETTAHFEWGSYWAGYIHERAKNAQKEIYVTEMWDCWDPSDGEIEDAIVQDTALNDWFAEFLNPDIHKTANFSLSLNDTLSYQFLDVSNNNAQKGETHYSTAIWVRNAVLESGKIRPINNVKIYGGDRDKIWAGNHTDGKERFWRNVFAGHAAVRFHRPPSGIGLSEEAQNQIKSLRMLTTEVDFFNLIPDNKILSDREDNEAFCLTSENNNVMAIYFPDSGAVKVDVNEGRYTLTKINISNSSKEELFSVDMPGVVDNKTDKDVVYILKLIEK